MGQLFVNCAVCDLSDSEPVLTRRSFSLVRCRRCSLLYVNPQPQPADLERFYDTDAFHGQQAQADDSARNRQRDTERAALIAEHSPGLGRLLDVGCSTGSFLRVARERGFEVSGIEIGQRNAAQARSHGLEVFTGVIDEVPIPPGTFDVVTMFDSIEHMPAPGRALEAAWRLLRDDGLLVITTPNEDGWFPRLTWEVLGKTLGAWGHPTPPGHIYQFSRRTMRAMLSKTGFRPIFERTENIPLGYSVDELEDAIVEAVKARLRKPVAESAPEADDTPSTTSAAAGPGGGGKNPTWLAARQVVRAGCWLLAGTVSPIAELANQGDSMIVLARKRPTVAAEPEAWSGDRQDAPGVDPGTPRVGRA